MINEQRALRNKSLTFRGPVRISILHPHTEQGERNGRNRNDEVTEALKGMAVAANDLATTTLNRVRKLAEEKATKSLGEARLKEILGRLEEAPQESKNNSR